MSPGSAKLAEVSPTDRLDTLPPWPWDILDDEAPRTLGWHAIAWAEGWTGFPGLPDGWRGLVQPNGPRARKRFRFTERQKQFLLWFYALDDEAQWVYAAAVRRLAKGSGKSPFAAVHALIEFLAAVRLVTFRRGLPGGCEGRQVDMPLVQIAATAESQTQVTMRMVRAFAPKRSHVVEFYLLDPGKTIYYGLPERTLQVITSSVTAAEGGEPSFIVKDELEHWKPSNGGPELAATLDDNLAKSGARSLGTSNAWVPGIDSVAELDWDAWVAEQEDKLKDDAGRILYDAVIAPPCDMSDYDSLRDALEHVYLDCSWKHPNGVRTKTSKPDVRPIIRRIWSPRSLPDESKRKYLNRPTVAQDAWTTPEAWSLLTDATKVVADGDDIAMFFDGSRSRDATALIGCRISDGHVFTIGTWEPDPEHSTRSVVPVDQVDAAVARAFEVWNVQGFFADVREWESFTKVSWPAEFAEGLVVQASDSKDDPQPIAWDMRNGHNVRLFTAASELTLAEINDLDFTHDGDWVLARHVANARERENRYGATVGKESRSSPRKIDACVCMIGARMVRRRVLAELAKAPPKKKGGRVSGLN